jgi:replication factor C small subunit
MLKKLWVRSYMPTKLEDYVFQNEHNRVQFTKFVKDKSFPHLLLKGHKGSGKTTMALILKNELGILDGDFKFLNSADDNSINVVRNVIKPFSESMPLGEFKVVLLDEAEFLSTEAQKALCGMLERYSDTVRFILTCNRPHKIIPELKSRCTEFSFNEFDKKSMATHVYKILKSEGVTVSSVELLMGYVNESYPDMRKILQNLETNVIDGVLEPANGSDEKSQLLLDIVDQLSAGKWLEVRAGIVQNIEEHEWDEIYRFLYDNLDQIEGFDNTDNWKCGIIILADHIRFHYQVADPEINFSACMIRLSGVIK